jgi:hypothetical protein
VKVVGRRGAITRRGRMPATGRRRTREREGLSCAGNAPILAAFVHEWGYRCCIGSLVFRLACCWHSPRKRKRKQASRSPSAPVTVLKAAHLFDGRNGKLSEPCVVVVKGERIVAIGKDASIPADARIVDLGNATLVPGFIDAHTHITEDHNDNWAQGFYEGTLRSAVEQSYHAEHNGLTTLRAGVTTVRDVGSNDFHDVACATR